ncbi:MAG: aldehyde dehydrogenase family protein [Acidobacteriaceae bacterium]
MATTTAIPLEPSIAAFLRGPKKMLIGGEWVEAASGKTFTTYNPADGSILTAIAEGDREDVDRAVLAARRAFESGPWPAMSPSKRGRLLWKLAELVEEHSEEFAQLETLDNGKPVTVARVADVPLSVDHLRYMAGWATKLEGSTIPISVKSHLAWTLREPVGVVGQIVPWNFPLLMAIWKLGPALACGCTVVLKPAEQTPLSALYLGELILEAGFPAGVVNIVSGFGETAGAALAVHSKVDKIAFTGSTEVGKIILGSAVGNLKKVSLELGGKSPNIIFADTDLGAAVQGGSNAIFFNHGQCCTAGSRLFIEKKIFDNVVAGIAERANLIKVGAGLDPSTEMGPLVSKEQLTRVCGYLESGFKEGARALAGGSKWESNGYFMQPTVLVDTRPQMKVVREEIFGPVVVATPFSDPEEVLATANDSNYGLAAGVWTRDISKAHKFASCLKAGTVWINCYNVFDAALPFGGYKESGWGREMGREVFNLYTETKSVCLAL